VLLGGVVDQHIQAAELTEGPLHRLAAERLLPDVPGEGQAAPALGLNQLDRLGGVGVLLG